MESKSERIESELEIKSYLSKLKYALDNGATIVFQSERRVDENRELKYTNRFTVQELFPNEDPLEALARELRTLKAENYIRTVNDIRFPNRDDMREFGKVYEEKDVYIKIRVELLSSTGNPNTFVMSFHFAEYPFTDEIFPYQK